MTVQRTDFAGTNAGRVIALFLEDNDEPTSENWTQLIAKYPEHAGEIADAAMLLAGSERLVEADLAGPLDKAAYSANVSKALSLLHSKPSPVLVALEGKVRAVQGPAIRDLAAEVGLGAAPPLLSSVMGGSVVAPSQVLNCLALKFGTSVLALAELFSRSFESKGVPAFKASNGKPQVPGTPIPWKDAVMSFKLPAKQTQDLLDLDK